MTLKYLPWLLVGLILLPMAVVAILVAFGTAPPPPPMPAVTAVAVAAAARQPQPSLQRFTARDGAPLAYRSYQPPGGSGEVAVLIHGSGGSSADMTILGQALAARGVPAFAPDIRGHGDSGTWGDIGHLGQLEEDLADFVAVIRRPYPRADLVLVGHSSGGGFVLRVAGAPQGRLFQRFILLAPYLGYAAPTSRPASGGWVASYTGRIIGLSILNRFGVHAFDGLPTLAFAGPAVAKPRTWSFRLMQNFAVSQSLGAGDAQGYRADAARAPGPILLLAGDRDEIMYAERYAQAFADLPARFRSPSCRGSGT
uniref:Alpha/beta fold hydrolase n=1 Tax=Phenylobacterium glaciei TaxID=2803784 RepID=A0A974P580_9CAUL|nr:alpha/beta fold hydrolase [Phenylobacterium glaciei]